jgi:hypothetical protein
MRTLAVVALALQSALAYSFDGNVVVKCSTAAPAFAGKLSIPTAYAEWECVDSGGDPRLKSRSPMKLSFNGQEIMGRLSLDHAYCDGRGFPSEANPVVGGGDYPVLSAFGAKDGLGFSYVFGPTRIPVSPTSYSSAEIGFPMFIRLQDIRAETCVIRPAR